VLFCKNQIERRDIYFVPVQGGMNFTLNEANILGIHHEVKGSFSGQKLEMLILELCLEYKSFAYFRVLVGRPGTNRPLQLGFLKQKRWNVPEVIFAEVERGTSASRVANIL
jgi:hypothetical protein